MFGMFLKKEDTPQEESSPIYFSNTLSGEKEEFNSIQDGQVSMYSCGMTVYDYMHIGNLRAFILPDLIRRVLEFQGYEVKQAINSTDFGHLSSDADTGDDKMTAALKREGKEITIENMKALGRFYEEAAHEDMKRMNILMRDTQFPRASEYIDEQITVIKTLEQKGFAYETSDGLYFDTSKFEKYGQLGNIDVEKLKEGARVEVNPEKKNPADFALWKKDEKLGWKSPWGLGFPGWHIECTAMIFSTLGKQIDIHTGGIDLIPTHHNNEIAQAEAATNKPYVGYWMHNAFITIDNRKISKSLGNTIRLEHLEQKGINPLAYRYWLLTGHYKSPMNFTWEAIEGAAQALSRLHRTFVEDFGRKNGTVHPEYHQKFVDAINNDLDTPRAVALLWDLIKDEQIKREDKRATFLEFDKILAIGFTDGLKKLKEMLSINVIRDSDLPPEVSALVEERENARNEKDWVTADRLRSEIEEKGFLVQDGDGVTTVFKKS